MADSIAARTPWSSIVRIAAIVVPPGEVTASRSRTGCSLDAASMVAAPTRVRTISSWATVEPLRAGQPLSSYELVSWPDLARERAAREV